MNTNTPDIGTRYHSTMSGVQLCMIVTALTRRKMWGSLRSGRRTSSHPWQHSLYTLVFPHIAQEELVLFSMCKLTASLVLFPPLFLQQFKFLKVPGLGGLFVPLIGKRGKMLPRLFLSLSFLMYVTSCCSLFPSANPNSRRLQYYIIFPYISEHPNILLWLM